MTNGTWWDENAENDAVDQPTSVGWVAPPGPGTAPPPPSPPTYTQPQPQYAQAQYAQPQYAQPQAPAPKPKRQRKARPWGKIAIASLATVAVLAGAWVAYGYFTAGGASSPEEAVTTLLDGATSQDPLLMASVLSPSELPLLTDLLTEVGEARQRVGAGNADEPVPGTKIEISKLRTKVKELSPRVSRVTIQSGRVEGSISPKSLPEVARSAMLQVDDSTMKWKVDVDDIEDHLANGISAIVVEDDGGWYVSPTLTAADLFIGWDGVDLDEGDFDSYGEDTEFDPGAEDPEAAVDAFAEAISSGEAQDVVAALPSDQAQVAVVFGDAIETLLAREVSTEAGDGRLPKDWAQLKSLDARQEDGPEGMVRVVIDSAKVTAESHPDRTGDPRDFRLQGLKVCENDGSDYCEFDITRSKAPFADKIEKALDGSVSLLVREVDDGWKVDPVASVLDMAIRLVKGVDKGVAESAGMSLDGAATELAFGAEGDVSFNDDGLARVRFATTPGSAYYLAVDGERLGDAEIAYNTKDGGVRRRLTSRDGDEYYTAFVADTASTTVALGGLLNEATAAKVTVYEVPVEDHAFDETVQGALTAPIALHRIPVPAPTSGSGEDQQVTLDANASGGDIRMGLTSDDLEPGNPIWAYADFGVGDNDPQTTELTVYDDIALMVIEGPVGAGYTYRLSTPKRGFDGNRTTGSVTIAGGTSSVVNFDLGNSTTDFVIEVSWDDLVDVDSQIQVGGDIQDSESTSSVADDVELSGTGSGSGRLTMHNFGSAPTTVNVSIHFG